MQALSAGWRGAMKDEQYYSIGKASKICDVSTRMLRYYEEIGLITPDRISEQNGYRYYTIATMRNVQAIRYLAAQGFSLEEIRQALTSDDLDMLQSFFYRKDRGNKRYDQLLPPETG